MVHILFWKLFWPTVNRNCYIDQKKLLKICGWRLEQFISTVTFKINFWNRILFRLCTLIVISLLTKDCSISLRSRYSSNLLLYLLPNEVEQSLLHKDKEFLALRNNFRATKKLVIAKFDCTRFFEGKDFASYPASALLFLAWLKKKSS